MTAADSDQVIIGDRYRLVEMIGRGGTGIVWQADDTLLRRPVAVKDVEPPRSLGDDESGRMRRAVLREARTAARLSHPGAVKVYDLVEQGGHQYLVMSLVHAPNLAQVVKRDGPLAPEKAGQIGLQILDVLEAAHAQGIVHRDVKPANIMLPDTGPALLGDFGVASVMGDPTVTPSGVVMGTPCYMAPEQGLGRPTGPATDLWSLGATLYFAAEGRPPFQRGLPLATLAAVTKDDPRPTEHAGELAPVISRLLTKDPEERPAPEEVRSALAHIAPSPEPAVAVRPDERADLTDPGLRGVGNVGEGAAGPATPLVTGPTTGLKVAAAGAVAAALASGGVFAAFSGHGRPGAASDAARPAAASGPAAASAPTAPNGGTIPPGWTEYTDPEVGFRIAHPPNWRVTTDGRLTDITDPANGAYLRVDHQSPPAPTADGPWYAQEQKFRAEYPSYRRIQITRTTFHGYPAALWEFTYTDGVPLHAIDVGMIAGNYGFALNFQSSQADWGEMQGPLAQLEQAFQPQFSR